MNEVSYVRGGKMSDLLLRIGEKLLKRFTLVKMEHHIVNVPMLEDWDVLVHNM